MTTLVSGGYLSGTVKAQQKGQSFKWQLNSQQWALANVSNILTIDNVTMGSGWFTGFIRSYTGSDIEIIIPNTLGDGAQTVVVKSIYQDAFKEKGLTSVTFDEASQITRIHARALQNNNNGFITAYETGGAGTYVFDNGNWIKE